MKKIIKHLAFIQNSSAHTCQYLSGKEINTIQLFCFGLLRRIDETATSTELLIKQLEHNPKFDFAVGILFRALLLDTLISMNMLNLIHELEAAQKTDEEMGIAIKEFCEDSLSDGLKQTLSYIEDAEKYFHKTPAETAATFKNLGATFKPFFDNYPDDGTKPVLKYKDQKTAKKWFEVLAKTNDLNEVSKLYDSYAYLSKYDHFGIVYYHAINEPLDSKIGIYSNVSEAFVAHNTLVHVILSRHSQDDQFLNEQKDKANSYLLNEVINMKTVH